MKNCARGGIDSVSSNKNNHKSNNYNNNRNSRNENETMNSKQCLAVLTTLASMRVEGNTKKNSTSRNSRAKEKGSGRGEEEPLPIPPGRITVGSSSVENVEVQIAPFAHTRQIRS